jgi:hypothetical protein
MFGEFATRLAHATAMVTTAQASAATHVFPAIDKNVMPITSGLGD